MQGVPGCVHTGAPTLVIMLSILARMACRAYATSMTSVRPSVSLSVTLVDYDHVVHQKVEMGT